MKYPRTVAEAVQTILSGMSQYEMNLMCGLTKDELASLHHTLGMRIRNEFGLWDDNYELLMSSGMVHPDDASRVILQAVWEAVRRNNGGR
jgi:hypothetical protein